MTLIFFSKSSKFDVDSKNALKKQKNIFGFLDNCIWIGSGKFSLLWRKYSSFAVNVLITLMLMYLLRMLKLWDAQ